MSSGQDRSGNAFIVKEICSECRESLVLDFLYRRYHHEDGITIEPIDPDDVFASMGSDTIPGSDTPLLPVLRCTHMHPEEASQTAVRAVPGRPCLRPARMTRMQSASLAISCKPKKAC